MTKVKIVVSALTPQGIKGLKIVEEEEEIFRVKLLKSPLPIRLAYNKPTKEFIKHKNTIFKNNQHIIYRRVKNEKWKDAIYKNIKLTMIENDCSLDDFEVRFYDE